MLDVINGEECHVIWQVANEKALVQRAAAKREDMDNDARLNAEWGAILDKQVTYRPTQPTPVMRPTQPTPLLRCPGQINPSRPCAANPRHPWLTNATADRGRE